MYIICNNVLNDERELIIPLQNRAFLYNDGFFETMIMKNGKICFWDDHLQRMENAMKTLRLNLPDEFTSEEMYRQLSGLANVNQIADAARFRIRVWRDGKGRYTPEPNANTCYLITAEPFIANNTPIASCSFCSRVRNFYSPLSAFKGPQTPHYILAALEKEEKQTEEIIILNHEANISEALSSNIFWIKQEKLFTPALETGCIAGIMRKNIVETWQQAGYEFEEGYFKTEEILTADLVFTSNVAGIRSISKILDNPFLTQHPKLEWLQQKLCS